MSPSIILLHLAAALCLLIWGIRMVKTGFVRLYGANLRKHIQASTKNRMTSCFTGFFAAFLLQSATSVTLLLASFMKQHKIPLVMGLAMVIGADIATTIIAQILIFDLKWLSPLLIVLGISGYLMFESVPNRKYRFRILIGIGFMLLALTMMKEATLPLATSETLPLILAPLEYDPATAIIFAALLTWLIHSSLASVLLFASLAGSGVIQLDLALLLVMGANIGGALIPSALVWKSTTEIRHVVTGNIIMRSVITVVCLTGFTQLYDFLSSIELDPARTMIVFHTAFNVVMAILFLPLLGPFSAFLKKIHTDRTEDKVEEHDPQYLEEEDVEIPTVALASASRETLRMAEIVQKMLENTIESFKQNDTSLANAIRKQDNTVDKLYAHIKLYLTRITSEALEPSEADKYLRILTFATNLEHIGDTIDKSLMEIAKKKTKHKERFSEQGWKEIKDFHQQVVENMRLAQNVFLTEDKSLARQLVQNKREIAEKASQSAVLHFERLSKGLPETIATSSLHLDIIRDYRHINSQITAVAYSVLDD